MQFFIVPQNVRLVTNRQTRELGDTIGLAYSLHHEKDKDDIRQGGMAERWSNSNKAADSISKARRWFKVIDKLEAASPGDRVVLEDGDMKTLQTVVAADGDAFASAQPMLAAQLADFYDAIANAKECAPVADAAPAAPEHDVS